MACVYWQVFEDKWKNEPCVHTAYTAPDGADDMDDLEVMSGVNEVMK